MTKQKIMASVAAFAMTVILVACGGGGNSPSTDSTTTSQGVISGFGSVFVNGVEYAIDNGTNIRVNGSAKSESDLQLGMLVTVKGIVHSNGKTGTASEIDYANLIDGVVTANGVSSDGTGTLTVMGQTVTVTVDTVFDSDVSGITSADLIQVGNVVEVSGYTSSTGDVTATRLEVKAASQTAGSVIDVKGTLSDLDTGSSTFVIGGLTVDYSGLGAADLPGVALADGLYVEVESTTQFDGTGSLIASAVRLADDGVVGHNGTAGEHLGVCGLVTADYADGQFELNGRTVLVDANTVFVNGSAAQLLTGAKVMVKTHFDVGSPGTELEFAL